MGCPFFSLLFSSVDYKQILKATQKRKKKKGKMVHPSSCRKKTKEKRRNKKKQTKQTKKKKQQKKVPKKRKQPKAKEQPEQQLKDGESVAAYREKARRQSRAAVEQAVQA
jgi:hypothetical protein